MKKLLSVLLIAGAMTACKNGETKDAAADSARIADSLAKVAADTSKKVVDTTKPAVDTTKPKM